jgi:hypothetical protein
MLENIVEKVFLRDLTGLCKVSLSEKGKGGDERVGVV